MVFVDGATLELLVRLAVSAILGAVVGFEREVTHKPAGLRTHMLVSLGAALFTILSVEYFQLDPARVAAGIVTGIGFIGAGSIIATRGHVYGVTTAASLWAVAAIGLAAGLGAYLIAIVATIFVFLILQVKRVEKKIVKKIK
jgi:putative Mg2+ transporter-C (MgtC) family protein